MGLYSNREVPLYTQTAYNSHILLLYSTFFTDAKRENNLLKEKNSSLQQYIDVITLLVMENNPGLLNHELLHQATANLGTTTVDGEVSEDESDLESI